MIKKIKISGNSDSDTYNPTNVLLQSLLEDTEDKDSKFGQSEKEEVIVSSIFHFSSHNGEHASAIQINSGFLVLKNSKASANESKNLPKHIKKLRVMLVKNGVLMEMENQSGYVFANPYLFKNETEATRVICGNIGNRCNLSHRIWKDSLGKSAWEYKIEENIYGNGLFMQ